MESQFNFERDEEKAKMENLKKQFDEKTVMIHLIFSEFKSYL